MEVEKVNLRKLGFIGFITVAIALFFFYPLDSYVSKPGGAYELEPLIDVIGGEKESNQGTFNLMTVAIGKATPFSYTQANFSEKVKLLPSFKVRRPGEDDAQYNRRQRKMMSDSQFYAMTVAFNRMDIPFEVKHSNIYVETVMPEGAANNKLLPQDQIVALDDVEVTTIKEMTELINEKQAGDAITIKVLRNDEELSIPIKLQVIPNSDGRVGLGIHLSEDRSIESDVEVDVRLGEIGGPSAGLMFTLEIMNQLIDEDLTKGYQVAGTGEILEDGAVGRIGSIDFKVIAADRDGMEIFFAPDDEISDEMRARNPSIVTNYEEARKTAEKIGTSMKVVPVKTVDDALQYLESLPAKQPIKKK